MTPPECGCRVVMRGGMLLTKPSGWRIEYCPKHQAVDKLIKALETLIPATDCETCRKTAKEAIAQAEGGKDE